MVLNNLRVQQMLILKARKKVLPRLLFRKKQKRSPKQRN